MPPPTDVRIHGGAKPSASRSGVIPPDLNDEEQGLLGRLRAGKRVEHYQTVRLTKAGDRIDACPTISPLRDPAGSIVGCSKIARDITEARRAEAALLAVPQRGLGPLGIGDVAGNLGASDDPARGVSQRRDRQRDIDALACLGDPTVS